MRSLVLTILTLSILSCKSEPVVNYSSDQVHGYWEIFKAKRNNKVTNTLNGAWVKILGNEMMDNFFSNETAYEFKVAGNTITHLTNPSRDFKIEYLTKDTMKLSTVHNDSKFDFEFKKVAD